MDTKLFLLILLLLFVCEQDGHSQWSRTGGPCGGAGMDLAKNGEFLFSGSSNGIYRSDDEGLTWDRLETGLPLSLMCYQIRVQEETLLFFGSDYMEPKDDTYDYDIYKSVNNGDDWYEIHPPDSVRFPQHIAMYDSLIFVAENSLLRTADDGLTWITVLDKSDTFYNSAQSLKIFNEKLYVLSGRRIWITDDWGDTWSTLDLPETGLHAYDVYVKDNLMVLVCEDEAYRSLDAGVTWEKANGWHDANPTWKDIVELRDTLYTNSFYVLRSTDQGLNWEIVPAFSDLFYPQGIVEFQGGLFAVSHAFGIEFAYPQDAVFQQRDYGMDATYINCLSVHNESLWAGSSYNGLYRYDTEQQTWDEDNYFPVKFDISDIAWVGDSLFVLYDFGDLSRSGDGGAHWSSIPNNDDLDYASTFYVIGNTLFVVDSYGAVIAQSEDYGDTWNAPFPEFKHQIGSDPIGLVQNGGYIFVTDFDRVYRSADGGITWEEKSSGLIIPEEAYIRKIFAEGEVLFIESFEIDMVDYSFPLKLYSSVDNGENWTLEMDGLPDIRSYSQDISSVNDLISFQDTLVMGTDLDGIYFKTKSDDEWHPLMVDGVFPEYVTALAMSTNKLFAGTGGMGVWQMNASDISSGIKSIATIPKPLSILPNPALDHISILTDQVGYGNGYLELYNLEGKLVYGRKLLLDQEQVEINISGISGGEYVAVLQANGQKYSGKFIKL